MNTSSLSGFSPSYLQQMLSHELTTNTLTKPSQKNGSTESTSPFSQLMSDLTTASKLSAPAAAKSSGNFVQNMMSLL